ncbi:hypothetical protein PVL30_000290 [Lodderomyces elongisporus]|uniref:uncharacterized protein n=1 Tax=Lodderomyces elongisporus TaxID=36914 RepID=UPI0029229CAE|nr:uncharacterized protein PVL30_000290 [Lodderomyces elongisporus]WLF76588.1 hypothetical protein PVL30_000290 [Lodderomyces elongisporus]
MLYALADPNSAFKPSIKKVKNSWRLKKFKDIYLQKKSASANSSSNSSDIASSASSNFQSSRASIMTTNSTTTMKIEF